MKFKKNNSLFYGRFYLCIIVSCTLVGCGKQEQLKKEDPLVTVSAHGAGKSIGIGFESSEFELGTMGIESSLEEIEGGIRHKYSIDGYTADLKAERIDDKFFLTVLGSDDVFVNPQNTGYQFIGEDGRDVVLMRPGNKYEVKERK